MTRKLRPTFRTAVAVALALAVALTAGVRSNATGVSQRLAATSGTVAVAGQSTLHPWTVTSDRVSITGVPAAPLGGIEEALAAGRIGELIVEVPVRSLKAKDEGINKNTYKALNADAHPTISFRLRSYTVDEAQLHAKGTLTINGVERDIELALNTRMTAAGLEVSGEQPLLMTDFGVKPPTAMLGMIKARNEIVVRFTVVLTMQDQA
jgi:hypothetical protein